MLCGRGNPFLPCGDAELCGEQSLGVWGCLAEVLSPSGAVRASLLLQRSLDLSSPACHGPPTQSS